MNIPYKFQSVFAYLLLAAILLAACTSPVEIHLEQTSQPVETEGLPEPAHEAGPIVEVEELIIGMLFISAVVSLVTQRLRIPYTTGLVLVGFGLTFAGSIRALHITPELILALLVPPLVYEAAFHLNFADLRRELGLVLMLAIPGVILTTFLVGGVVSLGAGIGIQYALVFGALIAATDPVAVVALFRSLGVPKRLQVLLEGESLFNDGTAIVLFGMMSAAAMTGRVNLGSGVIEFIIVAGGGVLIGAVLGIATSQLIGRIDNYLVETTFTTVLAYGSYLIAEYFLGVSGVLAVVAAGLASGVIGPRGMSPTTRIVVYNFWDFAGFLANSFIFLIIGLEMDLQLLVDEAAAIAWAILAVLGARAVVIYGVSQLHWKIPLRWKNILFWGGLRGAISLALALSLPLDMPFRSELQAMAFGVVFFTLIVQGLTMQPLIRASGIVTTTPTALAYERSQASAAAVRAARLSIHKLNDDGAISNSTARSLIQVLDRQLGDLTDEMHAALEAEPGLRREEMLDAWRESLRARRSTLISLFRDNIITQETYEELAAEVDAWLDDPEAMWLELQAGLEPRQAAE